MPKSDPPRRSYRGSRSGRDLASGKLDVTSSSPTGPAATEHRPSSAGSQPGVSGGGHEPGPSNGPMPSRNVPAGPGHMRPSNRRGILIAAGAAGIAAGAGGLVYDRKRRRAGVSKVYNPYTGETVEFGKTSNWQKYGVDTRFTGKKGKGNRQEFRERSKQNFKQMAPSHAGVGGAAGAAAGAALGRRAGRTGRGALVGAGIGALGGADVAGFRGNDRARSSVQRDIDSRGSDFPARVKKRGGILVPASSSTSVRPLLPRGPHVSHENDLSVTTRRGQRKGSPSALARYSSGSQTQMTGGGQAYGHRASHVRKSVDTQQFAAARGTRGTPMSGLAQAGRVGRRLDVL